MLFTTLLPSANEVWGKLVFSQASVILSTGGGGWLPSMHHRSPDSGGLHPGEFTSSGFNIQGVCIQGVCIQGVCIRGEVSASEGVCIQGGGGEVGWKLYILGWHCSQCKHSWREENKLLLFHETEQNVNKTAIKKLNIYSMQVNYKYVRHFLI